MAIEERIVYAYDGTMASSTLHAFSSTAALYNSNRARLIPGCDQLYGWVLSLVPANATRILDLGAGTGFLSALVREAFPAASLHLIDFSDAMLAQARTLFRGDGKVTFDVADYSTAALAGGFDAVVSALSIHHLEDADKQQLFGRVWDALRPGGVFVNAEQVLGPTDALEARYRQHWLQQVKLAGATEREIEESLFRQQHDRCATVEDQLVWMRAAGFADADCWFKHGRFATLAGSKPA